jgi:hypothetical protein
MANLGSFGAALREADPAAEQDTFEFCGTQFAVRGEIPAMLMLQLGAALSNKIDEAEGMAAVWEALRCSLTAPAREVDGKPVPEDGRPFAQLYKLAVNHNVSLEDLMKLTMTLFEAQSGRPTVPQPASSDGQRPTSTSSNSSASPHPGLQGYRPLAEVLAG